MIDNMLGRLMFTIVNFINGFFNANRKVLADEKGAINMIEIIVIIVIVIAIAVIFRDRLTELVGTVFDRLTDFVG